MIWGHDRTWERSVVERIRRGGAAPQMADTGPTPYWDPVGVYAGGWEHAEAHSKDAIRTNAVYLNDEAIAARKLQRKLLREGLREALAEAKERQKKIEADRLAEAAARREAKRLWDAQLAERIRKEREERDAWFEEEHRRRDEQRAKWLEGENRRYEENKARYESERILGSKWICTVCNGVSWIKRDGEGYRITCIGCGKSAWGAHASLWGVLSK
jgi:rubrerythrin